MILKHTLYKYISICTVDSILAFFKQNTVLFMFNFTDEHSLTACSPKEQQDMYMTSKFSETLCNTYKLHQTVDKNWKPEDHWSCIAHLIAEDILKSVVIEEKTLGRDRQPIRAKILMSTGRPQHYGHLLQVYKESLQPLTLYTSFHDLINLYSRRSGADMI